jgi:thiosulfate/3-mercaptopyruvate sulfurtransferase
MNRALFTFLLTALLAFAGLAGCGSTVEYDDTRPESERNATAQPLNEKVFVDIDDFVTMVEQDGALVLDARKIEDYEAGHIPGAVWANGGKEFQDDMGLIKDDTVALQQTTRELGINLDTPVIIYGEGVSSRAGRLFWSLEYLGHGNVYLYPNGYESLLEELGAEPSTEAVAPELGDFVVARRDSIRATGDEVLAVVNGEATGVLIDTRRIAEFEGTEDRGDPRQGYIPGATYYYWEDVYTEEGKLRARDELQEEFSQLGFLEEDVAIIPYCQTGVRSATVYAVLRWLGIDNAKNYDGSWYEWSRANDFPVAEHGAQ